VGCILNIHDLRLSSAIQVLARRGAIRPNSTPPRARRACLDPTFTFFIANGVVPPSAHRRSAQIAYPSEP
jgi:hypothetical protein